MALAPVEQTLMDRARKVEENGALAVAVDISKAIRCIDDFALQQPSGKLESKDLQHARALLADLVGMP